MSGSGGVEVSTFQTFVSLIQALAWPVIIFFIALQFSEPGKKLLDQISSGSIKAAGAELTFEAIVQSGNQNITQQVTTIQTTPLPIMSIDEAEKSNVESIPQFIQKQVQALDFIIGSGRYNPSALKGYLDALIPFDFFRYMIFLQDDRTFFGMIDARTLVSLLQDPRSGWTYSNFIEAVNTGNGVRLAQLPGFVPASESIKDQTQKREALERMEGIRREWLPVTAADGKFRGIIDRARLTASIVLDVTNRLAASPPQN